MEDFYAIPSPIAVFLGIITAFLFLKGKSEEKLSTLLKGCGEQKILTMCLIYLLAMNNGNQQLRFVACCSWLTNPIR